MRTRRPQSHDAVLPVAPPEMSAVGPPEPSATGYITAEDAREAGVISMQECPVTLTTAAKPPLKAIIVSTDMAGWLEEQTAASKAAAEKQQVLEGLVKVLVDRVAEASAATAAEKAVASAAAAAEKAVASAAASALVDRVAEASAAVAAGSAAVAVASAGAAAMTKELEELAARVLNMEKSIEGQAKDLQDQKDLAAETSRQAEANCKQANDEFQRQIDALEEQAKHQADLSFSHHNMLMTLGQQATRPRVVQAAAMVLGRKCVVPHEPSTSHMCRHGDHLPAMQQIADFGGSRAVNGVRLPADGRQVGIVADRLMDQRNNQIAHCSTEEDLDATLADAVDLMRCFPHFLPTNGVREDKEVVALASSIVIQEATDRGIPV